MGDDLDRLATAELIDRIRLLCDRVTALEAERAQDKARIAELEAQLAAAKKNSRNSSKPPSSDITKPPVQGKKVPGSKAKRKIGGQQGHPKHDSPRTVADADRRVEIDSTAMRKDASRDLVPAPDQEPKVLFQYEFVATPVELVAYSAKAFRDRKTGEILYAPFPREVEAAGILGPRLTAFAACIKGGIHASFTGTEKILGMMGVDVCRATLCNKVQNVSAALKNAHGELLDALPAQPRINVDETGHKDNPFRKSEEHGKHWIWVFATTLFTVFKIFGTRSTDVLREVLGAQCEAILGSDFYSAYQCFANEANVKIQYCWAHLIREIKFLSESPNKTTANYGHRLLAICRLIFHTYHQRESLGDERYQRKMKRLKAKFLAMGRRGTAAGTYAMVKRLKDHGQEYFLFVEDPTVEPTNNLAEREIRHCVIDRRVTQGTRGDSGKCWSERIWTVLATCARQKRSAFDFIAESIRTYYTGQPQPSLLPAQQ